MLTTDSSTDPERLYQKITHYWKDKELDETQGDIGFIVLDLDCNSDKANLIKNWQRKEDILNLLYRIPVSKSGFCSTLNTRPTPICQVMKQSEI